MSKPLVIISGKDGQLGRCLQDAAIDYDKQFSFLFTGREDLDLAMPESIPSFFLKYKPAYFINCAAYTAVDKAETDKETALAVNAGSVGILAFECDKIGCTFITISTDYVFNGQGSEPYRADSPADPVNYYGYSKWIGENLALANNKKTIIVRTSWVYSQYGSNFVKTMLRLMKEKSELSVVNDQSGSPTYAADLAVALLHIIDGKEQGNVHYGICHYSNRGVITWYEFALAISSLAKTACSVKPTSSSAYPTIARRPAYSVMDISQSRKDYGFELKDWQHSLSECIRIIKCEK